jgi:hypothetical protein
MKRPTVIIVLSLLAATSGIPAEKLLWHEARLDEQGKLLSWCAADSPYDRVVRLAWDVFKKIPVQPNGFKTYFTYPVFYGPNDPHHALFSGRAWTHNPASLFAMLTDTALLFHAYSGDPEVMPLVRAILDHHMARGSTKAADAWPLVPFASSDAADPDYRGATDANYTQSDGFLGRGDGVGFIEPDKVGELGLAYLRFHEFSLETRYLDAARHCADALARHVREGDASHSPWPFRVDARGGTEIREDYTSNAVGPIRLLDEMIRTEAGDTAAYRKARDSAWRWLLKYPIENGVWSQYFEDIYIYPDYRTNINQYCPLETARYLLENPDRDPEWRSHVQRLMGWVREHFAIDSTTMAGLPEKGVQWGAEVLSEQVNDMDKMASHTARYASILALWHERTGDLEAREEAFRSFNWATYACREDGLVKTSLDEGTGYWFSDGYGDYMRHFLRGMASVPEWAPPREDHLLESTSVIRSIKYREDTIEYRTFHPAGIELLKLRARPKGVLLEARAIPLREDLAGPDEGYCVRPVQNGGHAVRIQRRDARAITVSLGR